MSLYLFAASNWNYLSPEHIDTLTRFLCIAFKKANDLFVKIRIIALPFLNVKSSKLRLLHEFFVKNEDEDGYKILLSALIQQGRAACCKAEMQYINCRINDLQLRQISPNHRQILRKVKSDDFKFPVIRDKQLLVGRVDKIAVINWVEL
eukprot:NODE_44_length_33449_cov_1.575742.p30 type:complete len:149 gc:universal NODE_44_length_33449_cov_1.575742:32338-32784(+)